MKCVGTFASRGAVGRCGGDGAVGIGDAQFLHFLETLVQTEIVADRVFPAGRRRPEVRKVFTKKRKNEHPR